MKKSIRNGGNEYRDLVVLSGAVENTNEAFVTIDEEHRVLVFNRAAERLFGYSREEVIGQDLDRIMSPECSRNHRLALEKYLRERAPAPIEHAAEVVAVRKGGEMFPADISFSVSQVYGKLYFTGIIRDLSRTKSLQDRLLRAQRLADLGTAMAEISHEIKNPLMMIGGFARQLTRQITESKAQAKLDIIVKEVERLESLLKGMREYYSPDALQMTRTEIGALLTEIRDFVMEECMAKKVEVVLDLAAEPLFIRADRDKLKQVLLNLVKNATEAMEEGGRVILFSRRADSGVEIRVSDNGPGIPEEEQEKLFAPFYSTKPDGSGLGLKISKSIIETHEGFMKFQSKEGEGTVVTLFLPNLRAE